MEYLFWFFLVTRLIENDRDFAVFYGALVVMALCIAAHGIYQYIVAAPIPSSWVSQTEASVRTRVYSLTGSPNIMGSLLVLFAPMVAGLAYYSSKMWVKVLAVCATGMMCLSCIFTFSKGAWGGLAVAVVIFAIFLDRRLIALMGVAGVGALLAIPSIANRITYLFTADYLAASRRAGRVIRWSKGLKLLQESNPVLGFGLGRFGGAVAMQNKVIEETKDFSYFYMDNYYLKNAGRDGLSRSGVLYPAAVRSGAVEPALDRSYRLHQGRPHARAGSFHVRRYVRRAGALLLREYLRGAVYDGVFLEHGGSGYVPRVLPKAKN